MSHSAIAYVKSLMKAPDGSKIKGTPKALLMLLADSHNEGVGFAFPSMKTLANQCGISDRYCRNLLARLERKGVIQRAYTRNSVSGGQSSSIYYFVELGRPETNAKLLSDAQKLFRIPRTLMPDSVGRRGPASPDRAVREGRTHTTGGPGFGHPPIEPLREPIVGPSQEHSCETYPHIPQRQRRETKGAKDSPTKNTKSVFGDLSLGQMAWASAMDELRKGLFALTPPGFEKRTGFENGAKEWRAFYFNSVAVESVEEDDLGALVLVLTSPKPKATGRGIEKYRSRIARALRKFYGREAKLAIRENS